MIRRARRVHHGDNELNITAFMNLMVILVPFLLLTLVFSQITILDLRLPKSGGSMDNLDENLSIEIIVKPDALLLSDTKGGLIKKIPKSKDGYDYAMLSLVLQEIKRRIPDKKDITILAQQTTSYQTIISIMDTARSFRAMQNNEPVNAELFPDISIGDAPINDGPGESS